MCTPVTAHTYGGDMKRKLFIVGVGIAIGYLFGSHAGRERYDQITARVIALWENPRVTRTRNDVEAYARQQAPLIRERAEAAAKAAPGVAKDVRDRVVDTARDVAAKTTTTARDVADRVTDVATDVRDQAGRVAADLRERGEAAVDSAIASAGEVRDKALDVVDDEDDPRP